MHVLSLESLEAAEEAVSIAYAPALLRDDLALNAALFYAKTLGKGSMHRAIQVFSTRMGRGRERVMPFAKDAPRIALRLFGDIRRTGEVAADFSMLGAYCAAGRAGLYRSLREEMTPEEALKLCASLVHCRWMGKVTTSAYRLCPECIAQDLGDRGFSAWRASHQAPWLGHCTTHGCELLEAPYAFTRRGHGMLPGLPHEIEDADLSTISREAKPSDGYAALMALWHSACTAAPQDICIENWVALISKAKDAIGSIDAVVQQVDEAIRVRWGMDVGAVGRMLGIEPKMTSEPEIKLRGRPSDIARRFITYDAIRSLGLSIDEPSHPSQGLLCFSPSNAKELEKSDLLDRLIQATKQTGVSASFCRAMMTSMVASFGSMELEADRDARRRVAAACDDSLLLEIWGHFERPYVHWAGYELRRRSAAFSHN